MEDVLVLKKYRIERNRNRLNPCCSGRCSSTNYWSYNPGCCIWVLILVVVEDVLVLSKVCYGEAENIPEVLILVVVEDVLVPQPAPAPDRLNPCCSGRCSSTHTLFLIPQIIMSLNPCCSGRCSSTHYIEPFSKNAQGGLNPCCSGRCSSTLASAKNDLERIKS